MTEFKVTWVEDDDADWSWLDQDEFKDEDRSSLVALGCIVAKRCESCGTWSNETSLWGVTFYDHEGAFYGSCAPDELEGLPYQLDVARDLLAEAGMVGV